MKRFLRWLFRKILGEPHFLVLVGALVLFGARADAQGCFGPGCGGGSASYTVTGADIAAASTCTDSVGTDAWACYPTNCTATLGATTPPVVVTVGTANTGGATFAFCGAAAKAVVRPVSASVSTALVTGDVLAGQKIYLAYSVANDNWQMGSVSAVAPTKSLNDATYCPDLGASDAYVCSMVSAPSSYAAGMLVTLSANTANTGTASVNVNSLGVKTIVRSDGLTLQTGDITAAMHVILVYDGTNFRAQLRSGTIISPAGGVTIRSDTYASGSDVGLTVQGSPTGNIQNWKNSADSILSYVDSAGTFTVPNPGYIKNSGGANSYLQLGEGTGTLLAYGSATVGLGTNLTLSQGGARTLALNASGMEYNKAGISYLVESTSATRSFTLVKGSQNVFRQAVAGVTLTEAGGAETVLTLTSATTNTFDVIVDYRVTATDGTDRATRGGSVRFVCDNAATVVTCSAPSATDQTNDGRNGGGSQFISTNAKTLTYAIAVDVATANVAKLTFNIDSDMAVTAASITMTVTINGTVTPS